MSVDPWSWGDDNSDQDWTNMWSKPAYPPKNKNVGGFGGNPGVYGGSNNNTQPPVSSHQGVQRHPGWGPQSSQPGPQSSLSQAPPNSTADYFSGKPPLPSSTANNNPFPEVENKEIAPPDHHHSASRQGMKLGSKQGQLSGARGAPSRPEAESHYGNIQQVQNAPPPPMFSHPPENHHQPMPPYPQQNAAAPRNPSHHYFTDNRKDFFQTDEPKSWSYFDQMGAPMPKPANGPPPSTSPRQPDSLPPDLPPTNFFQDHNRQPQQEPHSRPPQHEPHNINYFQMHDKMDNFQKFNSGEMPPQPHEARRSPRHEPSQEPPSNAVSLGNRLTSEPNLPSEKDDFPEQILDFSKDQYDDRPPSYVQDDSIKREYSRPREEVPRPKPNEERTERYGPQGFEENPDDIGPKSQEWNRKVPPPPQTGEDRPESRSNKYPGFQRQVSDDRTGSKEWSSAFKPQVERPTSREWPGSQPPPGDRPTSREWSAPPQSQPQSERPVSREHSLPLPVHPDKTGSQEWRGSQHLSQGERSGSQGREWSGPFPTEEKSGHQRTGSLGSDRSGSLGRDLSGSERSGSSRNTATHRSDPIPRNEATSSRSERRSDLSGPRPDPPGPRNDIQRPRPDQAMHRPDPSPTPQSEGTMPRPDRVPSRSPGAGEDRSTPPTRPDNLESLPPESHITQQLNQLSLQPKDKMGDCPLDRNEYLETSQLSNQESVETDVRGPRHPSDNTRNSHRGERREVVGEAEPLGGRVVVGHTTPTTTPPPHNHSDEVDGGGSGSMERMIPGERREQGSRNNRSTRRRNHHRRESSYEEDDQDYSSDNRRGHRDDFRREERHRKKRGQDHRSSDYMSDDDYEIDRRAYSRRDRRGRDRDRDRDRDYEPDYRRDYYRDDRDLRTQSGTAHTRSFDRNTPGMTQDGAYIPEQRRPVRGGREYYRYDDDEYSYRERSRPSSRSGSDYRRTNLEYQTRNQSRHYFNPSLGNGISQSAINTVERKTSTVSKSGVLGGREYEANPEYFEMLRKTNPMLYAIWYQDYMRKLQDTATHSAFTQSDRASIHSGQSSGNRLQVSTPNQVLDANVGNADSFDDYSPRLFSTPHVRGSYDSQGRLLVVNACSPLDGQSASVQLLSVEPVEEDPSVKEFLESPGPFIPGVTHRSSVLQYLRKMSDQAVKGSEKLLYDLVHLIVKSNGKPDAGDISEMLLESYRSSKGESRDEWDPDPSIQSITHQEMLFNFRSLLHQGNKQEALEWAMKHNGWGHALFLASKMDARTQNRVAGEFARSLAACDPLSTLYQIMSGGVPAAATACSDRRWADWRPHLAMILSNLTDKPATDLASVTTLADGLASRGRLYAAHSCYIIAQVMFGELYRSEGPVLLGCCDPSLSQPTSQTQSPLESFNYRSFLLTLCYEYAVKQGQPNFFIPALQRYKLLVAWRLVEWGRGRPALLYCELLASELLQPKPEQACSINPDLVHLVVELSSALKALDPSSAHAVTDLSTCPDPDWLQQLKQFESTLPQEEVEPMVQPHNQTDQAAYPNFEPAPHVPMYRTGGAMDASYVGQMRQDEGQVIPLVESQPHSLEPPASTSTPSKPNEMQQMPHSMQPGLQSLPMMQQGLQSLPPMQQSMQSLPSMQQGLQSLPPMQQTMQPLQQPNSLPPGATMPSYPQTNFVSQPQSFTGYDESGSTEVDHTGDVGVLQPSAWEPEKPTEPPSLSSNKQTSFFHASENLLQDGSDAGKVAAKSLSGQQAAPKSDEKKKADAANGSSGSSWLGGIFGKLSMKPKNQMILPDDKNPTIIFDEKRKQWVDRDSEGSNETKELKPPPMGGPLGMSNPVMPQSNPGMPPNNLGMPMNNPGMPPNNPGMPPSNMTNKYKLQKGKSMKSNYVDILSNSGVSSKVNSSMDQMMPPMGPTSHSDAPTSNPNYFVPQPVDGQVHNDNNYQGQMPVPGVPTMYNPANFKS